MRLLNSIKQDQVGIAGSRLFMSIKMIENLLSKILDNVNHYAAILILFFKCSGFSFPRSAWESEYRRSASSPFFPKPVVVANQLRPAIRERLRQ
jgi:hypothetical protein